MKITPVAQGNVVGAIDTGPSQAKSAPPDKIARAKAIAAGQAPVEQAQSTGDPQADRAQASIKKIKMRTNVSTNRHEEVLQEPVVEEVASPEVPKTPLIEPNQVDEATKPLDPEKAALIKAKRAIQVKEMELAKREEALKSQVPPQGDTDFIAKLKANPLSVLQEAGVTYDQLTEAILNNQSGITPELQALKTEMKALKDELETKFTTRDELAEQQVLSDIKKEAIAITAEGEQFEAIREAKAQKEVVKLIHRTWKKTGEVLDVAEAAELVENQLIEEALPFTKLKKVQSRLTPTPATAAQTPAQPKANTKVMRTLTNRDSASTVMSKRDRAIAAMNGTLKR